MHSLPRTEEGRPLVSRGAHPQQGRRDPPQLPFQGLSLCLSPCRGLATGHPGCSHGRHGHVGPGCSSDIPAFLARVPRTTHNSFGPSPEPSWQIWRWGVFMSLAMQVTLGFGLSSVRKLYCLLPPCPAHPVSGPSASLTSSLLPGSGTQSA